MIFLYNPLVANPKLKNPTNILLIALVLIVVYLFAEQTKYHQNADFMMFSLMSLQKLTFYYWGQDRLGNFLPLILSVFQNPSVNFFVNVFLCSFFFILNIAYISYILTSYLDNQRSFLKVFMVTILTFLIFYLISTPYLKNEVIGQNQYFISALFLVASIDLFILKQLETFRKYLYSFILLFICLWVNFSAIFYIFFIACLFSLYDIKYAKKFIPFLFISVCIYLFLRKATFLLQDGLSVYNYSSLTLKYFFIALPGLILESLRTHFNIINTLFIILLFSIFKIIYWKKENKRCKLKIFIQSGCILFIILWTLICSLNTYVSQNAPNGIFPVRYLLPSLIPVLILVSIIILDILKFFTLNFTLRITFILYSALILLLFNNTNYVQNDKILHINNINNFTHERADFYAGNYWVCWPAVLRDMMHGNEKVFGLSDRGLANAKNVIDALEKQLSAQNYVDIICLDSDKEECTRQISSYINASGSEIQNIGKNTYKFRIKQQGLSFFGSDFVNLYNQFHATGQIQGNHIVSNGGSGTLLYGPYTYLRKGKYKFNLSANMSSGQCIIDISYNCGQNILAKYTIENENQFPIDQEISVPEDISGVEVRIWVNPDTQISVEGYSLVKVQP